MKQQQLQAHVCKRSPSLTILYRELHERYMQLWTNSSSHQKPFDTVAVAFRLRALPFSGLFGPAPATVADSIWSLLMPPIPAQSGGKAQVCATHQTTLLKAGEVKSQTNKRCPTLSKVQENDGQSSRGHDLSGQHAPIGRAQSTRPCAKAA